MKMRYLILTLSLLFFIKSNGQENEKMKDNFIGKWEYIKTVDKEDKTVKFIMRKYPNGKEMKIIASGPDIIISADGTYEKKFNEENTDLGNWRILSDTEIEYELLTPMNSRGGKLIKQTQKFVKNRWKKDGKGNYTEKIKEKIISITDSEMKVERLKDYLLIYKKISE
jgi:hypothetical protein